MGNEKTFLKPNKRFNHFDYVQSKNQEGESHNFENSSSGRNSDDVELDSFLEIKSKNKSNMKLNTWMKKNEEQKEIVKEINDNNLSWKAEVNEEFTGLSFMQLKEKIGMKKNKSKMKDFYSDIMDDVNSNAADNKWGGSSTANAIDTLDTEINEDSYNDVKKAYKPKDIMSAFKSQENFSGLNSYFNKEASAASDNNNIDYQSMAALSTFENRKNMQNSQPMMMEGRTNVKSNYQKKSNGLTSISSMYRSKLNSRKNNKKNNSRTLNQGQGQDQTTNMSYETQNRDKDGKYENDYNVVSKYINKELEEIDENFLPKNWDWRDIAGNNYIHDPEKQGDCGSCYIFSIVSSLESRLRILTNNQDKTKFSRQFPLSCSFYTEGCDGGYPILVAKFFSEFEIVPEQCFEYKAKNAQCSDVCDYTQNPKKYFVTKYEYLGNYGATNEIKIMKELRARGPIPGNMTVPWSFSYYKSGIYSEHSLKQNTGKLSKTTLMDKNLSWTTVDHSILLVGYGEENGTKYWIGMNTWGRSWGENGFFRILRGENDCSIETMGDAARVSFKQRE